MSVSSPTGSPLNGKVEITGRTVIVSLCFVDKNSFQRHRVKWKGNLVKEAYLVGCAI